MRLFKYWFLCAFIMLMAGCNGGRDSNTQVPVDPVDPVDSAPSMSADSEPSLSIDTKQLSISAANDQQNRPSASLSISISSKPKGRVFVKYDFSNSGIAGLDFNSQETGVQFYVNYKAPNSLPVGTYNDILTLYVCLDQACSKQIKGSPAVIPSTYLVTAGEAPLPVDPDANLPAAIFSHSAAMPHDVVDAEFSNSMNSVVMVSSYPSNQLYRYDVQTGKEYSVALPKTPTSVSVSPDGLYAAVGHDALISYVNLKQLTDASPVIATLNVSVDVLDVILAGNGYVYALPRRDQWSEIHSVEISSNTESSSGYPMIYAGTLAKLHPSGQYMYGANNGLSPSDIEKYDIRSGTAKVMNDSPYHGDYAMCGNLWFNASGSHIYTACGNTFKSTTDDTSDMTYTGKLMLSDSSSYGFKIVSLSDNAATKSLALIELPWYECSVSSTPTDCRSYLRIHENEYLALQTKYKFASLRIAGNLYQQHGKFVFHSSTDNRIIVISKLAAMPNPNAEYYINVM